MFIFFPCSFIAQVASEEVSRKVCCNYSKQNGNWWCLLSRQNHISKYTESDKNEGHSKNSWYSRLLGGEDPYAEAVRDGTEDKEETKLGADYGGLWTQAEVNTVFCRNLQRCLKYILKLYNYFFLDFSLPSFMSYQWLQWIIIVSWSPSPILFCFSFSFFFCIFCWCI